MKMKPLPRWLNRLGLLLAAALLLAAWQYRPQAVSARQAESAAPFLYPPFYGRASEESIFDHSNPTYDTSDSKIVTYQGETLTKACPQPAPSGFQPPNGRCDYGYGAYWSYRLGSYIFYNGHDGIDYGISYRPVLAAADASQVAYAGWYNPQDHRSNLGIFIRLHHANGLDTWYGHLSALAVQSCATANCAPIQHGDVIATSGTTGNSSGPHLHFRLTDALGRVLDPYGWAGAAGQDPWPYDLPYSLWMQYPNISASSGNVYPSGGSLSEPAAPATGFLVDDLSSTFSQTPDNCWNVINTSAANSQNGRMLAIQPVTTGSDTCKARWTLPASAGAGQFGVYVRIPVVHATSEGAQYTVFHNGRGDIRVLNQSVFPNPTVADGWVYLGSYYFDGASPEYVQLGNKTQDVTGAVSGLELAADAVRFVPLLSGTAVPSATPTVTPTASITSTPTLTTTPTITLTPTVTRTPTLTPTPTVTRTPTMTLSPAASPTTTLTRTSTATPVILPSATRWPTATPFYTLIKVYFANSNHLAVGLQPYEVARGRYVTSSLDLRRAALEAFFKGPGATELYYYGDTAIYNGFTGYSNFTFSSGVASVNLAGKCQPAQMNFSIAQLLLLNLKQFPEVRAVKLYDANGQTQHPDGAGDSAPACLGLNPTASPTPTLPVDTATPTLTPMLVPSLTPTPTVTRTALPVISASPTPLGPTGTATRWPTLTPRPTDTRWPTATTRP